MTWVDFNRPKKKRKEKKDTFSLQNILKENITRKITLA